MNFIIDANIIFSAIIKEGTNAKLLFEKNIQLYSPDFFSEEYLKYINYLQEKTKRTREELIQILHILQDIIVIIPEEEYEDYIEKAKTISPDNGDSIYFALAMKLKCPIWSNDKKLKEQDEVSIISTTELMQLLR